MISFVAAAVFLPFGFVYADKYGASETAGKANLTRISLSNSTPEDLAAKIVNIVLGFTATIFFLMMLYGGITWMTARGSTENVNRAKDILEKAIVGLVIIAASYAISIFIFSKISNADSCANTGGTCRATCNTGETENAEATDCESAYKCCVSS